MHRIGRPILPLFAAATCLLTQPVSAATASTSFPVSASIDAACTVSATALNFGTVGTQGVATSQTDSASAITVTCTTGGAYSVSLSAGLNAVAAQRYVKSETNVLAYDLYKDSARGTVWTNVAAPVTGTGTGTAQTIPIYGRIAAGLPFSADNGSDYADTVIVTLTF